MKLNFDKWGTQIVNFQMSKYNKSKQINVNLSDRDMLYYIV